jgi:hypothetical protein
MEQSQFLKDLTFLEHSSAVNPHNSAIGILVSLVAGHGECDWNWGVV